MGPLNLSWQCHAEVVYKKISRLLGVFWKIRPYLEVNISVTYYNSYVLPSMDYCLTVWGGLNSYNMDCIHRPIQEQRVELLDQNEGHTQNNIKT